MPVLALQRGFYLIFFAPLIASLAVAGCWYLVLTWSHCRNKAVAGVTSVALGLLLYLGYYHFGLLQIVGARNALRFDLLPTYVQIRMHTDVARDARHPNFRRARPQGPDRVQQAFNWFFFAGELILVTGVLASIGAYCTSRAYCEPCSRWMKAETLKLAPCIGKVLWNALQEERYQDVHTFLGNTSRQNSVGCNLTVEHCPACATEVRPQVVFLTVKDVVAPGDPDPLAAKLRSLFKPKWSAGLRALANQIELYPEEVGALAASFPDLKRHMDTHPNLFAAAQEVVKEVGLAQEPPVPASYHRLARIKPVEPQEAGTVLTRQNAIIQTMIGVLSVFGGFVVAFAPALILATWESQLPGWVMGVAVGWLMLCLVLNLFWILFFPTYFTTRFMLRRTRNAFEYRPNPAVDLNNPDLVFVDIVPRINWGKAMMENATDIGFLELNQAKR